MSDTDDCGYFDTHNEWSELIQKTLSGNRRQWFIELPLTMRQAITLELRARASVLVGKMREAHMENHPNGEMFYAGHTEGPWKVIEKANDYQTTDVVVGKTIVASNVSPSDSALIADAPLLLAEVKELRRQIKVAQGVFEHLYHDELEDAYWIRWFCNMESEEE
jgi:hypothetical protein